MLLLTLVKLMGHNTNKIRNIFIFLSDQCGAAECQLTVRFVGGLCKLLSVF